MKEFNILAALGSELSKPKMEARPPRDENYDPNKINWPYLRYSELKLDTEYVIRFLPSHPERNPKGFIKKQMYQFPYELDMLKRQGWAKHKSHYVMVPSSFSPKAEDPIKEILREIYDVAKSDSERGQKLRDDVEQDPEFKEFLQVLTKTWTQCLFPCIVYATCTETKTADGKYNRYVDYVPDRKMKNGLFRIFQINDVKELREEVLPNMGEKTLEHAAEAEANEGIFAGAWNDPLEGLNVKFKHTSGKPKSYKFNPMENRCALSDEIREKLALEGNYPDLVKRELENGLRDSETMMNLLKSCPISETHLIPMGFIK